MQLWAVKLGATVLLIAAVITGYLAWANHHQAIGEARATAAYNLMIDAHKKEAASTLAKETARVVSAERALQDFKNSQEVKDARNKKTVDTMAFILRDLAGPAGRLRDPNADAGCGGGGGSARGATSAGAGDRAGDRTETSGALSAELSKLLRKITMEADEINLAYISCRADAEAVRNAR